MNDTKLQQIIEETIKKIMLEQEVAIDTSAVNVQNSQPTQSEPQPRATIVNFDKDTSSPFSVKFTERGFVIDDTRLSFETIENALSKNYDIVLGKGQGLYLNQVKMQKILKYKDLYQ